MWSEGPDCARWVFDAAHGPLCGPPVCCWVSTSALLLRSACAGARRVREGLPVQGAQQLWRVPALHLRAQGPQRSRWPRCLAARAYRALFRPLNSLISDLEVCIGASDPPCRQPADARRPQGSLDSTLACLRPSAWPSQACGARQLGAAHNLVLHLKVLSGDPVPPHLCSQIRTWAVRDLLACALFMDTSRGA